MARQTDHADIIKAEVFPRQTARQQAEVLRFLQQLLSQLHVAERLTASCSLPSVSRPS